MLVPTEKLIVWVAVVGCGAMLAAAIVPPLAPSVAGIVLALVVTVSGDAVYGFRRRDEIAAGVPSVIRMTVGRAARVEVSLTRSRRAACDLRIGLDFPPEVETSREGVDVRLADGCRKAVVTIHCTARRRGLFVLRLCSVARNSPLGLWDVRGRTAIASELRVYPNPVAGNAALSALFLHRSTAGLHLCRQVGRGREFERLRDYLPGDSFDEVYWKATARRGRPITKVFQVEKTQQVYVAVDGSRLSARRHQALPSGDEAGGENTLDRCIAAALAIGLAAERQGDRFGLAVFSDHVDDFIQARSGKRHYGICRDVLYRQEPRFTNPDFAELAAMLRLRIRHRALIIVLTSLDNPVLAEAFGDAMRLVRDRHLILVNVIRPLDATPLFSRPPAGDAEGGYSQLGAHLRWADIQETGVSLKREGIDFALLDHDRFCLASVQRYLDVKRRQIL